MVLDNDAEGLQANNNISLYSQDQPPENKQTLADLVRQKYLNVYDDLSDSELEKAVIDKHPEYDDLPKSVDKKPSFLEKALEFATKPLVDLTPEMKAAQALQIQEHPVLGRLGEFGTGLLTGQSSPLGLGLEALGGASALAGLKSLAIPGRIAGAGAMVHGGISALPNIRQMIQQPNWNTAGQLTGNALEGGLGYLGARSGNLSKINPSEPIQPQDFGTPNPLDVPREHVAVGDEQVAPKIKIKPPEQQQYDLARNKFNMGRDLPHISSRLDEPQFARTESGGVKIGADIRSLGKVLGSSLYKGDIATIATKELLQNSIDAVRHLKEHGKIDVTLNRHENYVEVKDNGKGLSLAELHSVFSDLGSSGKRNDENAVGGFGLAKAAPLLGGEKVEVTTIVKEGKEYYEHKFEGTPEQLLEGVNIKTHKIPNGESFHTGTTVRTYVKKDSSHYNAKQLVESIARNSPDLKGEINFKNLYAPGDEEAPPEKFPKIDMQGANVTTLSNPSVDVDIIVPKGTKYKPRNGVPYNLANNGMYQSSSRYGFGEVPGVPENLIVNIRSKVPEGDPDYPFTANRESLRGSAQKMVNEHLENTIVKPSVGKRAEQLRKLYHEMPQVQLNTEGGKRGFFVYDVGKKFTPEELQEITSNKEIQSLSTLISNTLHEAMDSTGNEAWDKKLEKVGLIFDETLRGIHIPSPGEGKSAILINPFAIMQKHTPNEASAGILHVILHELAHVEGGGHDEDFAVRLANIYEDYGFEKAAKTQNSIKSTISDGQQYHPEIQNILQWYQESRGRQSTEDDPLRGTGISSENRRSTRKEQISINAQTNESRASTERAINKLTQALSEATPKREEQEKLYSQERAKRISLAESVKTRGLTGFHQQLGHLQGELPKVDFERTKLSQGDVNELINGITDSPKLLPYEKIRAKVGLMKLLSKKNEELPQRNELELLKQVYGNSFDKIIEMHGGLGGSVGRKVINEAVNLPKSILSSFSFAAPLRHGLPLAYRTEFWHALGPMMHALGSEDYAKAAQESVIDRPGYLLGKEAGLSLTNPKGDDLSQREESFMSNAFAKPLGIRAIGTAPWRDSYITFLNKLRADTFDSLVDEAKNSGNFNGDTTAKEIANFVNVSTGRGSLGRFEKIAPELNSVFYSPRMITSRLTMLNPNYYIKASSFARKEQLKALLSVAGATLTMSSLAKMAGGKVNFDPTNSDFMKSRFGNTRLDPNDAFQQYIVAATRLITGKTTSSTTNKTSTLGKGYKPQTRLGVIGRLGESHLSPVAQFVDHMLTGIDATGKPIKVSDETKKLFTPILLNDLLDIYKDDPNLLPLGIASAAGINTSTYKAAPQKFQLHIH